MRSYGEEFVTPEMAERYLAGNSKNRPLSRHIVEKYAGAMRRGEWMANGEPIIFGKHGNLIDGQHRLEAIILSRVPVTLAIVTGVDDEAFKTINCGHKRQIGHMFAAAGEKNATLLAGALSMLWRYRFSSNLVKGKDTVLTTQQAFNLRDAHPRMRDSVSFVSCLRTAIKLIRPSMSCALHYEASFGTSQRPDLAATFFATLEKGVYSGDGDPVRFLRERLISNSMAKAKLTQDYIMALSVKAWNYHAIGANIRNLRVCLNGEHPELMPKFYTKAEIDEYRGEKAA